MKSLNRVPYFLATSLMAFSLLLVACSGNNPGGGGNTEDLFDDAPTLETNEDSTTMGDQLPTMEPILEPTLDPNMGATEELSPESNTDPATGATEELSPESNTGPATGATEDPAIDANPEPSSGTMSESGSIADVDLDAQRVTLLLDAGETTNVNVDEYSTMVTIDGVSGTLQDLQTGDSVEVEVNQATNVAITINAMTAGGGF